MTDIEVIWALKQLMKIGCENNGQQQIIINALDFIYRQKDEIEKLNTVNADMHESLRLACETNKDLQAEIERLNELVSNSDKLKAEAIKEFALRAKSLVHHTVVSSVYGVMLSISENAFDNLVKEMEGDTE